MFICSGRIANSHTESSRKTMRDYGGKEEVVIAPVLVAGTIFSNGILSLGLFKFTYFRASVLPNFITDDENPNNILVNKYGKNPNH
jgi:hypothetical protein